MRIPFALLACLLLVLFLTASAPAPLAPGAVVGLAGTPHLWIADDRGVLHWGGDTRALGGRRINWNDRREVSLAELTAFPIGDPWLTAGMLKDGDPIYLVKWESEWERPKLLHIQSIEDVEIFGIDGGNYGNFVLGKEAWDARYGARYGLSVAMLERAELDAAVPSGVRVTRVPSTPTPTLTPTPTHPPTHTPTPNPTPMPEQAARAALSRLLPWYDDPPFPLAVLPIVEVWEKDAELGMALARAPWVQDGLGPLESSAIYGLSHLYDVDPTLARQMLAHSAETPVRTLNVDALYALGDMAWQYPESFKRLQARTWFADGLSLEERAFVIVLAKIVGDDAIYTDLLEERFTQTKTVDLPLSGAVGIWAFGHEPVAGDVLTATGDGALAAERVMASPFPVTDIIMLQVNVDNYEGYGYGGANFRDSMVLSIGSDWEDFAHAGLLYHEVAHYHLAFEVGPHWLVEGGADFVRAYRQAWDGTEDWAGEVPLFEGNEFAGKVWCFNNGVTTIAALAAPSEFQNSCGYALGQYFLTHLYDAIGLAAFSSAMREIYERYLDYQYHPTEEQVYRIFLKHVPADRAAAFRDVYRRLHGGSFLNGN